MQVQKIILNRPDIESLKIRNGQLLKQVSDERKKQNPNATLIESNLKSIYRIISWIVMDIENKKVKANEYK